MNEAVLNFLRNTLIMIQNGEKISDQHREVTAYYANIFMKEFCKESPIVAYNVLLQHLEKLK